MGLGVVTFFVLGVDETPKEGSAKFQKCSNSRALSNDRLHPKWFVARFGVVPGVPPLGFKRLLS